MHNNVWTRSALHCLEPRTRMPQWGHRPSSLRDCLHLGEGVEPRQGTMSQNFPTIFRFRGLCLFLYVCMCGFFWFSISFIAINHWLFSRILTKLILTVLTCVFDVSVGERSLQLLVPPHCWHHFLAILLMLSDLNFTPILWWPEELGYTTRSTLTESFNWSNFFF